jgi:hypothetical protein
MTKTKAVKLPYLVDLVAKQLLGHRVTHDTTYQAWDYGVVAREVFSFISHSDGDAVFAIEPHNYSEGGLQIRLRSEVSPDLSPDEQRVVDFVAEEYGRLDAASLGLLTKRLNSQLAPESWGSNQAAALDEDAFAKLSEGWQALAENLETLDITDRSLWGERIDNPREHLRKALGG